MECKKVQERLITEYLDNEMEAVPQAEIKEHLNVCADCREFLTTVQAAAVLPFKEAEEMHPDSVVWERIQEKLEAEKARSSGGFWRVVDALVSHVPIPLPVMRVAFATVLILVVVVLTRWPSSYADPVYGYISEQMTFMEALGSGNTDLMNDELKNYAMFEEMGL